jgi:two-component system response regulator DevR
VKEKVRVLLVDDHEIVRLGLKTLLGDIPWVEVADEAGTAAEALQSVATHLPDVVIMDIRMPGESGIDACQEIVARWPQMKVIMLTSFDDDALIFKALQAGASGYVLKQVGNQPLIDALDAVRKGAALLDPSVTLRLIKHIRDHEAEQQAAAFSKLSHREMTILAEVSLGKSNGQIANSLNLSAKTVRNHVSAILTKLGLTNRIEAATYAVRHNIERQLPARDESSDK